MPSSLELGRQPEPEIETAVEDQGHLFFPRLVFSSFLRILSCARTKVSMILKKKFAM